MGIPTKCWDCKKAVGGCSWAREFIPVEGWKAVQTKLKLHNKLADEGCLSFIVLECPEFKADAYQGGLKRLNEKTGLSTDRDRHPGKW